MANWLILISGLGGHDDFVLLLWEFFIGATEQYYIYGVTLLHTNTYPRNTSRGKQMR